MEWPFGEVALYCTIFTLVPLRVVFSFLMTSSYYFCSNSQHEQQYHYSSTSHAPKVFIQPWTGMETTFLEQPARGWMAFILYSPGYLFNHQTPPLPYLPPHEMCPVLKVLLVWKSTGMFTLTLIIIILSKVLFSWKKSTHQTGWVIHDYHSPNELVTRVDEESLGSLISYDGNYKENITLKLFFALS